MELSKRHSIRSSGKHRKLYVRVDCESCYRWECVACYEDDIRLRNFNINLFECKGCNSIICGTCLEGESGKRIECPFCGHKGLLKLKPSDIYLCNICALDDKKKLCKICRYPHLGKY